MTSLTALLAAVALLPAEAGASMPVDGGADASKDAGVDSATDAGATEPAPGEVTADPGLPAGVLIVELVDAQGQLLPGASLFVESMDRTGDRRRLEAETDGRGRIRVEDLPAGGANRIVVGHVARGGLQISTRAFQLPMNSGARVSLVVPRRTDDKAAVAIDHLHVVIERTGAQMRVTETMQLSAAAGAMFASDDGLLLPLPDGAAGLRFSDAEEAVGKARVSDEGLLITAAIPPSGLELTFVFDISIDGDSARFDQSIPIPTGATQVISTWTHEGARLRVDGLSRAEPAELSSGLTALVATGDGLSSGRLQVQIDGIVDGPAGARRMVALAASALALALGLAIWIRRRIRREAPVEGNG